MPVNFLSTIIDYMWVYDVEHAFVIRYGVFKTKNANLVYTFTNHRTFGDFLWSFVLFIRVVCNISPNKWPIELVFEINDLTLCFETKRQLSNIINSYYRVTTVSKSHYIVLLKLYS